MEQKEVQWYHSHYIWSTLMPGILWDVVAFFQWGCKMLCRSSGREPITSSICSFSLLSEAGLTGRCCLWARTWKWKPWTQATQLLRAPIQSYVVLKSIIQQTLLWYSHTSFYIHCSKDTYLKCCSAYRDITSKY